MFDSYRGAKWLGVDFSWRHGEYVAELDVPDGGPITCAEPDHKGHLLLYGADGEMIEVDGAAYLLSRVTRVLHGPSHDE